MSRERYPLSVTIYHVTKSAPKMILVLGLRLSRLTSGVEEVFLAISRKLVEQREEIEEQREALMYGRRQYSSVHPDDAPRPRGRGCTC